MSQDLHILAIESSCDDTSVAVVRGSPRGERPEVLSLAVQSQNEVHRFYGGVVPELASRAHLRSLLPCLRKVLSESQLRLEDMDLFAATGRPGLIGSLLVGHSAAKVLSFIYDRPFLSCDHLQGHRDSIFIESLPNPPYLTLVVSGGHSSLYLRKQNGDEEKLGVTLDDAAGEAFDKGAKLMGLGFPGGPQLEALATRGDAQAQPFSAVKVPGMNFSFSGLKSELARRVKDKSARQEDLAAGYQEAIFNHLLAKLKRAIEETGAKEVVIVGGVARNQNLRDRLEALRKNKKVTAWYAPAPLYCTDNAAMIGVSAYYRFLKGERSDLLEDIASTTRPSVREARQKKKVG